MESDGVQSADSMGLFVDDALGRFARLPEIMFMTSHWMAACVCCALLIDSLTSCATALGEESRFAQTHSRSQYVHWIDLYDADGKRIDPTEPKSQPYSPVHTCGRCHDYDAIAHGYHFNAMGKSSAKGRPGEPWIWTDVRTGTQIPMSYRGWPGTYDPTSLGITPWDFVLHFGHHMPGGGPGQQVDAADSGQAEPAKSDQKEKSDQKKTETAPSDLPGANSDSKKQASSDGQAAKIAPTNRWRLSGELSIDCMFCHSQETAYSPEVWWEQIQKQNFAWAPAAALGLADVEGAVSKLPDDFDPAKTDKPDSEFPRITYRPTRINAAKKIFFDVVRKPSNNVCYYCHTVRVVGKGAMPGWTHDEDVHLRAGMACSDCHRNGIEHHTVRGFEGEQSPTGLSVATLSCRGCHLGEHSETIDVPGGRFGAPMPEHRGLPPLHLERLACTACHSGPRPTRDALQLQTAMAHKLGLPSHHSGADVPPGIVGPVLMRDGDTLYPYRVVWPAFWGMLVDSQITPLNPDEVQSALRRVLRVRRGSTFSETMAKVTVTAQEKKDALGETRAAVDASEWTAEETATIAKLKEEKAAKAFREKLPKALTELKKKIAKPDAEPVYISGGRAYRLGKDGQVDVFDHPAAQFYAWKLAHDVRPARWASGVKGCFDCHVDGAPIFEGRVTAMGPAPDAEPVSHTMHELARFDKQKLDAWNLSFQGRKAFKWFGFASAAVVGLVLLAFLIVTLNGLIGVVRR